MNNIDQLIERSRLNFKPAATLIPVHENGEGIADQGDIEQLGLVCRPFWQEADDLEGKCYHAHITAHPEFNLSLRRSVAVRLVQVEACLPDGWQLVLKAGFRPPAVQIALLEALMEDISRRDRSLSDEAVLEHARAYVADPRIGCPPHTTGGAVDVDIIHAGTQLPIDMGCPPNTDDDRAALHSTAITPVQYENRLVLLRAMLHAGFAPLHNEWWHYSYGETRWAAFYEQPQTLYGIIAP